MKTILLYISIFIKIIIILTLIFILYKMNNFSIEKFYAENENTPTPTSTPTYNIYKITCGNTDNLIATTCKIYMDNINILRSSIDNPVEKNKITLDKYKYKIDASKNTPIMKSAIDKLNSIKINLENIIELEKLYIYIILIIEAFNNNIENYNLIVKNLPLILNIKKIKDTYIIANALNDIISLFNSKNEKYKISETYSLSDLTTIKTSLATDHEKLLTDINTQKDEYNVIIKDIAIAPRLNNISIYQFNLILKDAYKVYYDYKNSNLNYKIATIDEAKNLSNYIKQINIIHTSFINYLKALIGISETIDSLYLNVTEIRYLSL
jgi:hypothetical protein